MLQQVETSVDDPTITNNTVMTRAEKRFSAQAYCVLVLTCRCRALQVVQRVPRGFGFEAWRQLCEKTSPKKCVKPRKKTNNEKKERKRKNREKKKKGRKEKRKRKKGKTKRQKEKKKNKKRKEEQRKKKEKKHGKKKNKQKRSYLV